MGVGRFWRRVGGNKSYREETECYEATFHIFKHKYQERKRRNNCRVRMGHLKSPIMMHNVIKIKQTHFLSALWKQTFNKTEPAPGFTCSSSIFNYISSINLYHQSASLCTKRPSSRFYLHPWLLRRRKIETNILSLLFSSPTTPLPVDFSLFLRWQTQRASGGKLISNT